MNTNITITRDMVLIPSAKIKIVIPEDADPEALDDTCDIITKEVRETLSNMKGGDVETYESVITDQAGPDEDDTEPLTELVGESIRLTLPEDVTDILLRQLTRLNDLADMVARDKGVETNRTVAAQDNIAHAMVTLAEVLRA